MLELGHELDPAYACGWVGVYFHGLELYVMQQGAARGLFGAPDMVSCTTPQPRNRGIFAGRVYGRRVRVYYWFSKTGRSRGLVVPAKDVRANRAAKRLYKRRRSWL